MSHGFSLTAYRIPPPSGTVRAAVLMLHGVGSNGHDLLGLAPHWSTTLPDVQFVSVDAPFRFDMAPMGFQWFSLADMSPAAIYAGILQSAPILDRFIDELLDHLAIPEDRLALCGFSQGTMMALHIAIRRKGPLAGVLGYSGVFRPAAGYLSEITATPPVMLVHGTDDEVIPYPALKASADALMAGGVPVETVTCHGLGHSIDADGIAAGQRFFEACLKAAP